MFYNWIRIKLDWLNKKTNIMDAKIEFKKRLYELQFLKDRNDLSEYGEGEYDTMKKYENLILCEVGVTFKEKNIPTFFDWWVSEGYLPTERPSVFKNGCNLVLIKDLERKYKKEFDLKP